MPFSRQLEFSSNHECIFSAHITKEINMKTLPNTTVPSVELNPIIPLSRRHAVFSLIAASLSLHGCGGGGGAGGGGVAGVGSGGTGSFSVGVVTGFGSIIVNGVRYDDSVSSITDDDGVSLSSSDLKLGTVVAIRGSSINTINGRSSSVASAIRTGTELKGIVDSVAATSFVVLGQTINVNASTIYAPSLAGLASLRAGDFVEIHGFTDVQNNTVMAGLIERKSNLSQYRLTGKVSALNTTARTFNIGSLQISYAGADVRVTLADGAVVRVRLETTPASGVRTALRVQNADFATTPTDDIGEAEVHGVITEFTSISNFKVNGLMVAASPSTTYPDGTSGLRLGSRVEIKGSLSAAVLNASTIKIEDIAEVEAVENELIGPISALDTAAKTFVVRNVTVDYSAASTSFVNGTEANLANGRTVQAKGRISPTNGRLLPSRIQFE
jgi:Domain of unknown function (DUF5666)